MNITKIVFLAIFTLTLPLLVFAHSETGEEELVIRMTKKGFEPSEITVTAGEHVTFINADTVNRWPASNLHPTHGIYPEFDPLQGLPPGDSWEMTFAKAGKWRMHDHLIPYMTGVITVLDNVELPDFATPTTSLGESEVETNKKGFFDGLKLLLNAFFQKLGGIWGRE